MLEFKKLLITSCSVISFAFSLSVCARAAQIESLSVVDNTLYATTDAKDARLYIADCNEGLLSDVIFSDTDENGNVTVKVKNADSCRLFLWDRESLAPVSVSYNLSEGIAYASGSSLPVPSYDFNTYSFDQEDFVMVVSKITEHEIVGFKNGIETAYPLASSVTVCNLSDNLSSVTPGSVVLIATNPLGECGKIELLATLGMPVSSENFENTFGFYSPCDNSTKYQNIVTEMFSRSGSKIVFWHFDENGDKYIPTHVNSSGNTVKTSYPFASDAICYRVGIAMDKDTPIVSLTSGSASLSGVSSMFESTASYHNYIYLRYNTETAKIDQCVLYCIPKNFNPGAGGDGWTDIFSLTPKIIIE